jgi:hypothetical protein
MRIVRSYTGDDNQSHFEEINVPLSAGDQEPALSDLFPATGVAFSHFSRDRVNDFHVAPRRQLVVTLSGSLEIECADGSIQRFGPGDILFADDLTGRGHISRVHDAPRHALFVTLPDDFDVDAIRG